MKSKIKNIVIFGNLIVVVIGLGLLVFQVLQALDRDLYSYDVKKAASHAPHEDIVVIGIDEISIDILGAFPWDRAMYAPFLDQLEQPESKPKVIGFDVMFTGASNPDSDQFLTETLMQYDNIIFPSAANVENQFTRQIIGFGEDGAIQTDQWEDPYQPFYENSNHAHINARLDSDGVIRRNWLQINRGDGTPVYSLAFEMMRMGGVDVAHYLSRNKHKEILIDFQAASYDFLTVPFVSVLNGEIPPETFKDRYVLIGYTAPGFDSGTTAIEQEMKKVYAHANLLHQFLTNSYIQNAPILVTTLLVLLMIGLALWFTWRFKTIHSVLIFVAIVALILFVQYYIFKGFHLYINTVNPLAALTMTYLFNVSIKAYFETKQKNFITKQFGRYISPDLVKEIASSDQEIQLGGMNKELSILFLDVRGFTTLSERLKPEEVVGFLNMMFDLITNKALENKGTIDKFIGDAAMIIFNAPLDLENHEYYAVKTAYDIQKGMEDVRKQIQEKYDVTISVGVGVNTGEVIVGNIGSFLRVDYTCIGDNVNTASRIESQTVANQILVSEDTYERTKEYFDYHCIGEKMMKGKTVAVKLYEVQGIKKQLQ